MAEPKRASAATALVWPLVISRGQMDEPIPMRLKLPRVSAVATQIGLILSGTLALRGERRADAA